MVVYLTATLFIPSLYNLRPLHFQLLLIEVCTVCLVLSLGSEEAHSGGDRSWPECHRDTISFRERSGGDHGEAE